MIAVKKLYGILRGFFALVGILTVTAVAGVVVAGYAFGVLR